MTEKRFTIENGIEMKDNWNINKRCYHFGNGFDAKDCCNMLNELQEENKRLKSINQNYCNYIGDFEDDFIRLAEENKELKYKLRNCEDARESYKQDWKSCSSYCDEYKSKIISLKDEVEGLIEENKELKEQVDEMINIFNDSGLDYHISDELEEILND